MTRRISPFGIVDLLGDQVTEFREKPLLNHFINAGIYYIKKNAFEIFLSDYVDKEIETTVFPKLAKKNSQVPTLRRLSGWE